MKFVKLLLVFLIFAGALAVVIVQPSIFETKSNKEDGKIDDMAIVDNERKEIVGKWEKEKGWNKELHTSINSRIEQLKKSGNLSENGYQTLRNSLIENSSNKALEEYKRTLLSEKPSHEEVVKSYEAFVFLRDKEGLKEDTRVKEGLERHRLYTNVKNFTGNPHTIKPRFDTDKMEWVSFATRQSGILNEAAGYRGHKYYKDIKNWPGFDAGLESGYLHKVTDPQKSSFYKDLSSQIINHFSSKDPNEEDAVKLKAVFTRFANEGGETSQLASFRRKYEKTLHPE